MLILPNYNPPGSRFGAFWRAFRALFARTASGTIFTVLYSVKTKNKAVNLQKDEMNTMEL